MQAKVCDVFHTAREVETYKVVIRKDVDAEEIEIIDEFEADLCPRALKRLQEKIRGGLKTPPTRTATSVGA